MKRLLGTTLAVIGLALSPGVAHAADGAFHAQCTDFPGAFPGATGGEIIITPQGLILANCRYPGRAPGGGVETVASCVITPAGNFECHPPTGP